MKPYPKYKDSGVEWLGELPEGWEVKRLKYIAAINKKTLTEKTDKNYLFYYIDIGNVSFGKITFPKEKIVFENAPSRARRIVENGDTIVSTVRTYLKAISNINTETKDIIVSTGFSVISPKSSYDKKYIFYLLSCEKMIDKICSISVGVSYPAINPTDIANVIVWYPVNKEEQSIISTFLDHKTAEIDRLISNKERLIDLYEEEKAAIINHAVTKGLNPDAKMKDSGIEWLGEIPEHWEVNKIKYIAELKSGNSITSDQTIDNGKYPVYGGNGLRGYYDYYTHEGEYILIGRQGALCGNINYASGRFWASEHAVVLTLNGNYELLWLGELLRIMNLNQYSVSAAQPGLSVDNVKNLFVPVPLEKEQTAIAQHIETKCGHIDAIISKFKRQVELLKEYRTALISEAVTGKIDLREWQEKN